MTTLAPLRHCAALIGIASGLVGIFGAIILIWGSQDAMLVLIHWFGEEAALGAQNVIVQPNGSKLLTNPSAMARWMMLIWTVGLSQIVAGFHLTWTSSLGLRTHWQRNV